jgi:hypothetical protein
MIEKVGLFDDRKSFQEDFDFCLRCSKYTDFLYIDQQLSNIGRDTTNTSLNYLKWETLAIKIYNKHLSSETFNIQEKNLIKYYKGVRSYKFGCAQLNVLKFGEALKYFLIALKTSVFRNNVITLKAFIWLLLIPSLYLKNQLNAKKVS